MAYILKSNTTVADPDDRYEYYTRLGSASKEVAKYINTLELTGYVMSSTEFNALNNFVNNLKAGLVWDKVHEVYPLMGKDLNGAVIKLKTLMGGSVLSPLNGFNDSMLEVVNGKVLGKAISTASTSGNQPMLETGVTVASLLPSVGFHFYAGNAGSITASYSQPLIGALTGTSTADNVTQLAVNTNQLEFSGALAQTERKSKTSYSNTKSVIGYVAAANVVNVSTRSTFYVNGIKKEEFAPVAISTTGDNSKTLAIFGRKATLTGNGAGTSTNYSGVVRFGCITSGYLSDAQVAILHSEIGLLLTALGKTA